MSLDIAKSGLPQQASSPALQHSIAPFKTQLLKWVGNKQRFAHEIIAHFPTDIGTYHEPFIGSGAVMGTLAPKRAIGSDIFAPLIDIWSALSSEPEVLKQWYKVRFEYFVKGERKQRYEDLKASFNANPNGADFVFLSRACYGGVVRFRKKDGYMSTPCGVHPPIKPAAFAKRVDLWHRRLRGARFEHRDFRQSMAEAQSGDLIYCDPPYSDSQSILYGAQNFELTDLFDQIVECKMRGVYVALSIDGTKKSGAHQCDIDIPADLFAREVPIHTGRSMLKRFQMAGQSMETEGVHDRLLLTY